MQRHVNLAHQGSFDQAITLVIEYDTITHSMCAPVPQKPKVVAAVEQTGEVKDNSHLTETNRLLTELLALMVNQTNRGLRSRPKPRNPGACWACGEVVHLQRACSKWEVKSSHDGEKPKLNYTRLNIGPMFQPWVQNSLYMGWTFVGRQDGNGLSHFGHSSIFPCGFRSIMLLDWLLCLQGPNNQTALSVDPCRGDVFSNRWVCYDHLWGWWGGGGWGWWWWGGGGVFEWFCTMDLANCTGKSKWRRRTTLRLHLWPERGSFNSKWCRLAYQTLQPLSRDWWRNFWWGCSGKKCLVYLDDIIVFGKTLMKL